MAAGMERSRRREPPACSISYRSAATLPQTLASLPRQIPGIDQIEVLIVDDGSRDGTVEAARAAGVQHIVQIGGNASPDAGIFAPSDSRYRSNRGPDR